jgi:hypothetical protein
VTYDQSATVLKSMLREAGVACEPRDLPGAWDVLKRFAVLEVEDVDAASDGDQLQFATHLAPARASDGIRELPDAGTTFEVAIDRQFYLTDAAGEYLGMNALSVTLQFELAPHLEGLQHKPVYAYARPSWQAAAAKWVAEVESTPAFRAVMSTDAPFRGWIHQDAI